MNDVGWPWPWSLTFLYWKLASRPSPALGNIHTNSGFYTPSHFGVRNPHRREGLDRYTSLVLTYYADICLAMLKSLTFSNTEKWHTDDSCSKSYTIHTNILFICIWVTGRTERWSKPLLQPVVTRAHSFPRQILPNSSGHFAKFHGSLRRNCSNSTAHHDHPFLNKVSSVVSKKNFSYWGLMLSSVMLATFKEKYQSLFLKCNMSSQIIYDCAPYCNGY